MIAAGDGPGKIGRTSHQTSPWIPAIDDAVRRTPDYYALVAKKIVSDFSRRGENRSVFPPNERTLLPPYNFDQYFRSDFEEIRAQSGAALRLKREESSAVVMGNLYDVTGLVQMPYEEDWTHFRMPVHGSSVGAVASLIDYHAFAPTDELARRFGGPNFLFQSAKYRHRSGEVWAVEITEGISPTRPPDIERFIERFKSKPQRLVEIKTEEPIWALAHLLKTEGGRNIARLLKEPPAGWLAGQYTDDNHLSVWDSAGLLLNSGGSVSSIVLRFSEGARSGHQFIILREIAFFGEVIGDKIIWRAPEIGPDIDGYELFESYRSTISNIFVGYVTHRFDKSPLLSFGTPTPYPSERRTPSTPPTGASGGEAAGSTVSGLMEDTGETSGGANVSGAAHVHPATRGTAGRTQRRPGHTQLAGARRVIQAGRARPITVMPARASQIVTR